MSIIGSDDVPRDDSDAGDGSAAAGVAATDSGHPDLRNQQADGQDALEPSDGENPDAEQPDGGHLDGDDTDGDDPDGDDPDGDDPDGDDPDGDESDDESDPVRERAVLIELLIYAWDRARSPGVWERLTAGLSAVGVRVLRPDGELFDPARHEVGGTESTTDAALVDRIAETEVVGFADRTVVLREPVVVVYRQG